MGALQLDPYKDKEVIYRQTSQCRMSFGLNQKIDSDSEIRLSSEFSPTEWIQLWISIRDPLGS